MKSFETAFKTSVKDIQKIGRALIFLVKLLVLTGICRILKVDSLYLISSKMAIGLGGRK